MISIIIPVKGDRAIEQCLVSLKHIAVPEKLEIIVVDASTPALTDIARSFPAVRWLQYRSQRSKKYTFSEQINKGLRAARGNKIALIDADCIADKQWLQQLNAMLSRQTPFVSGRVRPLRGPTTYDSYWDSMSDATCRDEAGSANSLFYRSLLSEIGLYDERFAAGSDIDWSWRVRDAGHKIVYAKKAVIYDDWGPFGAQARRAYRYGVARVQLYKKHKQRRRDILGRERTLLLYPLFILGLPLAIWWPYYLLLLIIPLLKNINRNPLRFLLLNLIYGVGLLAGCVIVLGDSQW